MILYPETALAVNNRNGLETLLTMEMATYLCWYDIDHSYTGWRYFKFNDSLCKG